MDIPYENEDSIKAKRAERRRKVHEKFGIRKTRRKAPLPDISEETAIIASENKSKRKSRKKVRNPPVSVEALKKYPFRFIDGVGVTNYDSDIMPDKALEILQDGRHITAVAQEFGITIDLLKSWMKTHPEFNHAINLGLMSSYNWWLEVGRKNLYNTKYFNLGLFVANMKNRFGWHDRMTNGEGVNIQNNILQTSNITTSEVSEKKIDLSKLSIEELENLKAITVKAESVD